MPYIQCNGADLYYEDHGEGQPIVFLHGVMCSLRYFEPQVAGLSNEYRTVAVDYRGHGRSEKTEHGHTVAQYARDLHTLLDRRDIEDAVIVGWSMGAFVSWDYVKQFGTERIRGLVDVDIEASRFQWDNYDYGLTDLEGLKDTLTLIQEDQQSFLDRFTEQVFSNPTPEMRTLLFDEATRTPTPIKSAILFDALTRDYRPTLSEIDVPMLVCAGTVETRGPRTVESVRHVADLVPDAEFELFEDSGHCPPLEQPEQFNQVVSRFINSL
ncbi:MAG: alpha/beta fold hydrolase [Halobacteriota archaeon]